MRKIILFPNALPVPLFRRLVRAGHTVGNERISGNGSYTTTFWFPCGVKPSNVVEEVLLKLRPLVRPGPKCIGMEWWLGRLKYGQPLSFHFDRDLVLPLFYRSRTYEVVPSCGAPPVRGERIGGATVFFPLWWGGRDRDRSYLYLPPHYAHDRDSIRSWRLVMPLWFSYDHDSGRRMRIFFPLYWRRVSIPPPPTEPPPAGAKPPVEKRDMLYEFYGSFQSLDEFLEQYRDLMKGIASLNFLGGFCYTQLTDIEQEINGLLTYDRQPKIAPELIAAIHEQLFGSFHREAQVPVNR